MKDLKIMWDGILVSGKWWIIAVILFGALGISNSQWAFLSKVGQWIGLSARSIPQTELGKSVGFTEAKPLKPNSDQ